MESLEKVFNVKRRSSEPKSGTNANASNGRPADAPDEPVIVNVYDMVSIINL
jgi:hypothetical protein